MNPASALSRIVEVDYYLNSYTPMSTDDLAAIESCIWVVAHYSEVIWPYFGNLRLEIMTQDSEECRNMEANDLSYRVQLGVVN